MTIRCLYLSDQHLEFEQGRHFDSDAWADLDAVRKSIRGHPELRPLLAEFAVEDKPMRHWLFDANGRLAAHVSPYPVKQRQPLGK